MKKIILSLTIIIISIITLTGCGKSVNLDLEKISKELDTLQSNEFFIQGVDASLLGLENMEYVYDYDFKEVFGIDSSLIEEYNINYNKDMKELLAIIKPIEDKKEELEKQMDKFVKNTDTLKEEYQGYLIYINTDNNKEILNKVKDSKSPIFVNMMEVAKTDMEMVLGIKEKDVEEFLMKTPMMIVNSNTYIIVKPAEGKKEEVKNKIDEYMENLEEQWKTYLPEQYELVKDRKEEQLGEYLIYIVSSDNETVYKTIKESTK